MMNTGHNGNRQAGASAVEFGIIAIVFLLLFLGIVDFGRLLYVYNSVQEVTRRAAREAVVSDFDATNIDRLQRIAVLSQGDSTGTVGLPAGPEIQNLRVRISYLNESLDEIDSGDLPASPAENVAACVAHTVNCIAYVQAQVVCDTAAPDFGCPAAGNPVEFLPASGLFGLLGIDLGFGIPLSTVVMPAESLGYRKS